MNKSKIETVMGMCIVALTKYLMKQYGWNEEDAYKKLMKMELYELLIDTDSRLYLETNDYLCYCCQIECEKGKEALYEFINQ